MFTETNTNKNIAILVGVGLFLFFITRTFAIADPYNPGETLDPSCAAGDENCTVDIETDLYKENPSGAITNTTSGTNAIVIGKNGTASGTSSISIGQGDGFLTQGPTAAGQYSVAIGTDASTGASATGAVSILGNASGANSIAIGEGTNAYSFREVVVGSQPTSYTPSSTSAWSATDRLFNIGNGNGSGSDAFTVLKNGNIGIGDSTPSYILDINGTGAIKLPVGTTAQRPGSLTAGLFRYNSSTTAAEVYTGSGWTTLGSGGGQTFNLIKEADGSTPTVTPSTAGVLSVAIGDGTKAPSYGEIAVGSFNPSYTPANAEAWDSDDVIFVVGNGSGEGLESNALVVGKGGGVAVGPGVTASDVRGKIFYVRGSTSTVSFNDELGQWDFTSDRDLKTSIENLSYGLDEILDLQPKSFKYRGSDRETLGFIAQDVESVIPEIVSQNQDGVYSMSTEKIVPVLVAAVQELTERVEDLEDELNVTPQPKETPSEEEPAEEAPAEEEVASEESSTPEEESQQANVLASLGSNTGLNGILLIFAVVLLFANLMIMLSQNQVRTSKKKK